MSPKVYVQKLYAEQGHALFEKLYKQHRLAFENWITRKYGCDREDALEVFQQGMTVLFEKIDSGKLVSIDSTMKTYLYAICRNVLLKRFRSVQREVMAGDDLPEVTVELPPNMDELSENDRRMQRAVKQLNSGCQKLLDLFFYKGYDISAIAEDMEYKSLDVVRTKKYKCLRQLSKIYHNLIPSP